MVKAITYILAHNANLAALIGANAAGDTNKVYPVIGTQKENFPFVTVRQASRAPIECRGQRPTGFEYTYEVATFAKSYDLIERISDAIIDAIEDKSVASAINGVLFTDRIRNTDSSDGNFIENFNVYSRFLTFQAVTNESPTT